MLWSIEEVVLPGRASAGRALGVELLECLRITWHGSVIDDLGHVNTQNTVSSFGLAHSTHRTWTSCDAQRSS
jgi:hypothetical protein